MEKCSDYLQELNIFLCTLLFNYRILCIWQAYSPFWRGKVLKYVKMVEPCTRTLWSHRRNVYEDRSSWLSDWNETQCWCWYSWIENMNNEKQLGMLRRIKYNGLIKKYIILRALYVGNLLRLRTWEWNIWRTTFTYVE